MSIQFSNIPMGVKMAALTLFWCICAMLLAIQVHRAYAEPAKPAKTVTSAGPTLLHGQGSCSYTGYGMAAK